MRGDRGACSTASRHSAISARLDRSPSPLTLTALRTSPGVTSMSRSATWPAASLAKATPAIAALSVQRARGGMKSSTPSSTARASSRSRNRALAATPPPTPSRVRPVRSSAWRVLATRTSTAASWKLAARSATSSGGGGVPCVRRILAPEGVEDGRLQPREAEGEPIVVEERPREGERRAVPAPGRPLDLGAAGIAQAEQAGDLVERLARRVVDRAAEELDVDRPAAA